MATMAAELPALPAPPAGPWPAFIQAAKTNSNEERRCGRYADNRKDALPDVPARTRIN